MQYLKSYHGWELRFQGKNKTDDITLPKRAYKAAQLQAGLRNMIPVSDAQLELLKQSKIFRNLLARGKDGGYVLMDAVPDSMKSAEQRLAEANAEIARLKGPGATQTAGEGSEGADGGEDPSGAKEAAYAERERQLRRMKNADLIVLGGALGVPADVIKRADLIAAILKAEIDSEAPAIQSLIEEKKKDPAGE